MKPVTEYDHPDHGWKWRACELQWINARIAAEVADMEAMYHAQCRCTDEWAAKYRAEVERKADATLLQRVAELEDALAEVNARLVRSNA